MKQRTTTSDSSSCREQLRRGNAWQRLGMVLLVAVMMLTAQTAWAQDEPEPSTVTYIDANGQQQEIDATAVTKVTAETERMGASNSETWYYVSGIVGNGYRIILSGTVNLILADGCEFRLAYGFHLAPGNTLNIFAQSEGNGYLFAPSIGGDGINADAGDVNIYGGVIRVDNIGGVYGNNVDGGNGGNICIYGGSVNVNLTMGGGDALLTNNNAGTATITLSWTNAKDYVYADHYNGDVTLLKDFTDVDGHNYPAGMIANNDIINGKKLLPPDATLFLAQAEPTCTEVGYAQNCWYKYATKQYFADEDCTQEIAKSAVVIPALGHDMTHTEAQGATFTTGGNVEYWHCSRCNHYFGDANGENDFELDDASSLSYAVEGNATDGYSIRMLRKGTGTLTIDSSVSSFKIYDDGGVGGSETDTDEPGNYSDNCDGYLVLMAPEGYIIQLTGGLLTEDWDYLTVYAGTTTDGDVLLDKKWSDVDEDDHPVLTDIGTLVAPSMMLYFYSNWSANYAGLDLTATLGQVTSHDIVITESSDGEITCPTTSANYGSVVTLTATPAGDKLLSGVTVTITETGETVKVTGGTWYDNTASFVMPNAPVTVTATFSDSKDNLFINMPQTGTQTATIPSGITSVKIYDDGGSTGNYRNYCDGYLVLTAPQGYTIQLTGGLLTESDYDYLSVYAGTTTDGDVLLDKMSSIMEEPEKGIYNYTDIDQEVTAPSMLLYFHSDDYYNYAGLDLTATLVNLQPVVADLDKNSINDYVGQLVTIQNLRIEANMTATYNNVNLTLVGFSNLYDYAFVDLTGIVSLEGTKTVLTATDRSDLDPVVFVIDEDESFVSPDYDIQDAVVRLKRTLSKDYWNTFCVPLDLLNFSWEFRVFDGVEGNTMIFAQGAYIEAGLPYLVKPDKDIVNPVFRGIELSGISAKNVENNGFQFVGTYGLTDMGTYEDNQQTLFLKSDGKLYTPAPGSNTIKGMRAYFRAPKGAEARVSIDGAEQTVISDATRLNDKGKMINDHVYDLQGRRVSPLTSHPSSLKKGLYIQGGRKLLVR